MHQFTLPGSLEALENLTADGGVFSLTVPGQSVTTCVLTDPTTAAEKKADRQVSPSGCGVRYYLRELRITAPKGSWCCLRLYRGDGRVVLTRMHRTNSAAWRVDLAGTGLTAGMYCADVAVDTKRISTRLLYTGHARQHKKRN